METASLALPTVNIGRRQQGRLKAHNIIDCAPEPAAIIQAIQKARSPEFKTSLNGMQNPYGDGDFGPEDRRYLAAASRPQ